MDGNDTYKYPDDPDVLFFNEDDIFLYTGNTSSAKEITLQFSTCDLAFVWTPVELGNVSAANM